MRDLRSIRFIFLVLCSIVLFTGGCYTIKQIKPDKRNEMVVSPFPVEAVIEMPAYGDVTLTGGDKGKIRPIPGRLLVKIAPSEIAKIFRPTDPDSACTAEKILNTGILPSSIKLKSAEYTGMSRKGKPTFRLHLSEQKNIKHLKNVFSVSRASIMEDSFVAVKGGTVSSIIAEFDGNVIESNRIDLCGSDYYYLNRESILNKVFKRIGVLSMRRVFRSAETPVKDKPGFFRVVSISKQIAEAKEKFSLRTARAYPDIEIPSNMENWFLLRLDKEKDPGDIVGILRQYEQIQSVSADFPIYVNQAPDDTYYNLQWGLKNTGQFGGVPDFDIDIESAWADPAPAVLQPVVVAVIDSGFLEGLDELSSRLWTNAGDPVDGIDNDCNGYVDDYHGITTYDRWAVTYTGAPCSTSPGTGAVPLREHGTMVAGVIAAETANKNGIAGTAGLADVELMNITLGLCTKSAPFDSGTGELAEALLYAITHGADIVNMSFSAAGGTYLLEEMLNSSLNSGMILVASAGNDGMQFTQGLDTNFAVYPALYNGVIAVGGSQSNGQWWPGGNYGPGLDLVAPAKDIATITYSDITQTTPDITCNPPIACVNGTSFSAAYVSGVAAVVLGKYPYVTAPYMRIWLRATARDVLDPLGTGAVLTGDDPWTGAGMLDAGEATVALQDTFDQPVNVSLHVEGLNSSNTLRVMRHWSNYSYDAVAGSPDLGITVTTLPNCKNSITNEELCLKEWRLEYGVGDAPLIWFSLVVSDNPADIVSDPNIVTNTIDVPRTGTDYAHRRVDVDPGRNDLDTDMLNNNTLYTVRLTATNNSDREFTEYDWIIPTRAKLNVPYENTTLVGRWGWDSIMGFVDIRPNANYQISFQREDGTLLWNSVPFYPANHYNDPFFDAYPVDRSGWAVGSSAFMLLMNTLSPVPEYNALFPTAIAPEDFSEGWVKYVLNVQTENGSVDTDSMRLYLDTSYFPSDPAWTSPLTVVPNGGGYSDSSIVVADMGGGIGKRIFVHVNSDLYCIDPDGNILWDKSIHFQYGGLYIKPSFIVEDINEDGIKEIIITDGKKLWDPTFTYMVLHFYVNVFNPDGTLFNPDMSSPSPWPFEWSYPFNASVSGAYQNRVDVKIGDVTGDTKKEIIFYQRPYYYYGIDDTDIQPGYLHVLDENAQEVSAAWPRQLSAELLNLKFYVIDIDADNKDEIYIVPESILEGDGTFKTEWLDESGIRGASYHSNRKYFINVDGDPGLEVMSIDNLPPDYLISFTDDDNTALDFSNSWPVTLSSGLSLDNTVRYSYPMGVIAASADLVPGGYEEIILCYEKITVLDRTGQIVASIPEIDLNGYCDGIELMDVDNDTSPEIVVMVHRLRTDLPDNIRRGGFVEAYELDGTALSATDPRWPINVQTVTNSNYWCKWCDRSDEQTWNGYVTIRDMDDDGRLETIHVRDNSRSSVYYLFPNKPEDVLIEALELQ